MIEAHIADGDFVLIRPQSTARNGDIVVAQVEENAVTLKRFFKEKDRIRLQPANPELPAAVLRRRSDPGQADRRHPAARLSGRRPCAGASDTRSHRASCPQPAHSRLTGARKFVDAHFGDKPLSPSACGPRRDSRAVTAAPPVVGERMIDRLPPQSLEAEQSVLGAILIDRDAVVEVAEFLRPEDFYRQANGAIYAAILELFERREPIDIVTVAEALERSERARGDRRPRLPLEPLERDPDRRPRRPVRPDRRAQGGPPEPHRRGRPDRRHRLRGSGRDPGGDRPRRGGAVRGQPEAHRRRASARSSRSSTTPTTGSTTCTPTVARSAASGRASPTSTR